MLERSGETAVSAGEGRRVPSRSPGCLPLSREPSRSPASFPQAHPTLRSSEQGLSLGGGRVRLVVTSRPPGFGWPFLVSKRGDGAMQSRISQAAFLGQRPRDEGVPSKRDASSQRTTGAVSIPAWECRLGGPCSAVCGTTHWSQAWPLSPRVSTGLPSTRHTLTPFQDSNFCPSQFFPST